MFDYGNSPGNALVLKPMYMRHIEEMNKAFKEFKPDAAPSKGGLFKRLHPAIQSQTGSTNVSLRVSYATA